MFAIGIAHILVKIVLIVTMPQHQPRRIKTVGCARYGEVEKLWVGFAEFARLYTLRNQHFVNIGNRLEI